MLDKQTDEQHGSFRERELVGLHTLSREVPNIDAAVAQIARYSAELTLPQGTIHVLSDIHGEDQKLRHVINNASGRPKWGQVTYLLKMTRRTSC